MSLDCGSGSRTEYSYDDARRLLSLANKHSDGSVISQFDYAYDDAGVVSQMGISGLFYTTATVSYGYDNAYQLTSATRTGGNAYTETWTYDSAGKRTSRTYGGQTTNYTYDYLGRMTQAGTTVYGYDYWGNVTSVGSDQYLWDDADRLASFTDADNSANNTTFGYFPASWQRAKRVKLQTPPMTRLFAWDGAALQGLYDQNGARMWTFETAGLDNHLSAWTGGNTYYFFRDGLGSVTNVADSSQNTQSTYDYRAYGESLGTYSQMVQSPFRYTGALYENWHGQQYYLRSRQYMQGVGQFASRDITSADATRGWKYAGNSPTWLKDPYGLAVIIVGTGGTPEENQTMVNEGLAGMADVESIYELLGSDGQNLADLVNSDDVVAIVVVHKGQHNLSMSNGKSGPPVFGDAPNSPQAVIRNPDHVPGVAPTKEPCPASAVVPKWGPGRDTDPRFYYNRAKKYPGKIPFYAANVYDGWWNSDQHWWDANDGYVTPTSQMYIMKESVHELTHIIGLYNGGSVSEGYIDLLEGDLFWALYDGL